MSPSAPLLSQGAYVIFFTFHKHQFSPLPAMHRFRQYFSRPMLLLLPPPLLLFCMSLLRSFNFFSLCPHPPPSIFPRRYSDQERFTVEDVAQVVEYGRQRGVRIMIEIDTVPSKAKIYKKDGGGRESKTCFLLVTPPPPPPFPSSPRNP
jgi:hypothetical protein